MKIEADLNKRYILAGVLFGLILGGSFLVYAYNENWQNSPGSPSDMGHSPDEVEASWTDIVDLPAGFADGIDNAEAVECDKNYILIGDECKKVSTCASGHGLKWNGTSFVCVSLSGDPCNNDADCGAEITSNECVDDCNLVRTRITFKCHNPGTSDSYCTSSENIFDTYICPNCPTFWCRGGTICVYTGGTRF
jgi:hypothetical protein